MSSAAAAESWLCVTDSSTGFHYNNASQSWERQNFKADEKYLLRPSKSENVLWELVEVGEDYPFVECRTDFAKTDANLECADLVSFRFNRSSLKFVISATYGYFAKTREFPDLKPDSVFVAIGRCSEI